MAWTDERVEQLKELWIGGSSASQIAKTLGGVTRNAVIGKVHRLGLSNRNTDKKPAKAQTPVKEPVAPKPVDVQTEAIIEEGATDKGSPLPIEPAETQEQPVHATTNIDRIKKAAEEQAALDNLDKVTPPPVLTKEPSEEDLADAEDEFKDIENPEERESAKQAAALARVEANCLKLSLMDLNERTCKWPVGDPSTSDFHFCGLPCEADKSYCAEHAKVAYQPVTSRRERERNKKRIVTTGGSLISRF